MPWAGEAGGGSYSTARLGFTEKREADWVPRAQGIEGSREQGRCKVRAMAPGSALSVGQAAQTLDAVGTWGPPARHHPAMLLSSQVGSPAA